MEPIGTRAVDHLKVINLYRTRSDGLHGLAITILRDTQSMRVDDTVLGKIVMEIDANLRATFGTQNRSQVRTGKISSQSHRFH